MNSELAPLVLFCFDRPVHLRKVLENISLNSLAKETRLIIYCDGPPEQADKDQLRRISEVRSLVRSKDWCGEVEVNESSNNKGLAVSVIQGVSQVLEKYGKIIVLEDDLLVSGNFLSFMNKALAMYEQDERVISITAYIYPVRTKLPDTFFLRGADCWGWATWSRGWKYFRNDGRELLNELRARNLTAEFDFNNSYPYTQMLIDQVEGRNNSWAIRWYASAFLSGKLTLYPGLSLVRNIGIDGSGTHSGISDQWDVELSERELDLRPVAVLEDSHSKEIISSYFRELGKPRSLFGRILKKIIG
jgi:hypothetical protein